MDHQPRAVKRTHLFTALAVTRIVERLVPFRLRVKMAMLDWRLWRRRRNGATMIAVARKPA